MSVTASKAAWENSRATGTARLVLLALADAEPPTLASSGRTNSRLPPPPALPAHDLLGELDEAPGLA